MSTLLHKTALYIAVRRSTNEKQKYIPNSFVGLVSIVVVRENSTCHRLWHQTSL